MAYLINLMYAKGARGAQFLVELLWARRISTVGSKSLPGARKSLNNVTSTFFNTVHLLPKDLRFYSITWGPQTCFLPRAPF